GRRDVRDHHHACGGQVTSILQSVDLAVGYDHPILEGINLEVSRGEVVALLGGSGCGKSTLLRTVCGLLRPLAGQVRLFGYSLYDLPAEERNLLMRRAGVTFQQDALFSSMTIEDNVMLPLCELTKLPPPVRREMVRMRLELVGIAELARRLPANV